MTKNEAEEILGYVAQQILSPMAFDKRPAHEVWLEMTGDPFNQLCKIVYEKVEKPLDNSSNL
jgi:hypothetical protein